MDCLWREEQCTVSAKKRNLPIYLSIHILWSWSVPGWRSHPPLLWIVCVWGLWWVTPDMLQSFKLYKVSKFHQTHHHSSLAKYKNCIYIWTLWPLIGRQTVIKLWYKISNAIKPISTILWQSTVYLNLWLASDGSEKTFLTVQSNKIQSYPSAHFFGKVQAPEPSQESRQSENCINYPNSINTFLTKYKCSIYISPLVSWSGQYMMCFYLRRV